MRRFFFLIFLFTLLIRGVDEVYTGKLLHTTCFLADQEFRKNQKNREEQNFAQNQQSPEFHFDIICEESGNDLNQDYSKMYKVLTGFRPVAALAFYHQDLYVCFKDRLPVDDPLACKYISQRTLRI